MASLFTAASIRSSDDKSKSSLFELSVSSWWEWVESLKGEWCDACISRLVRISSNDSSERITLEELALELMNSSFVTTSNVFSWDNSLVALTMFPP